MVGVACEEGAGAGSELEAAAGLVGCAGAGGAGDAAGRMGEMRPVWMLSGMPVAEGGALGLSVSSPCTCASTWSSGWGLGVADVTS